MNVGKTDHYLNGLNLSATFSFLMKLSDDTLELIHDNLLDDMQSGVYQNEISVGDTTYTAINWHLVTIQEILRCSRGIEVT